MGLQEGLGGVVVRGDWGLHPAGIGGADRVFIQDEISRFMKPEGRS